MYKRQRNNTLKFGKGLLLDVDMCADNFLCLPAQSFAIELSTSHPQETDYNNCLGKHILFLTLFFLHCQNQE